MILLRSFGLEDLGLSALLSKKGNQFMFLGCLVINKRLLGKGFQRRCALLETCSVLTCSKLMYELLCRF